MNNAMKKIKNILSAAASALLLFLPAVSNAQSTTSASRPGNWIQKTTFTSADGTASYEDMTWYDGLGYPMQTVAGKAGGTATAPNIVTPIVYDNMRRDDARTYLPFATSEGLDSPAEDAVASQAQFYSALYAGETRAYAEKVYEPSPAGRPLSATREGHEWTGHPASMDYAANSVADGVMRFSYNRGQRKVQRTGTYAPGTLIRTTSTDEDGHRVEVFTDTWGKTICSRQFPDGDTAIETHYVYDLKDSLVCVIQPKGMDILRTDAGISEIPFGGSFAQANCFTYLRDGLGRVIESQVPGGGVSEYAYDERSRLVACASAEMAAHRLYRITRYDALDRVVSEYYAMFAEGTDAESLRLAMKTWDGSESALPAHTTVRRTYSASYYPFQTAGSGSGGGSGHILPDPFNPSWEGFAQLDDEAIGVELNLFLDFAPDALATSGDLDTEHHRGLLEEETVSSVPGIDGSVSNADTLSVTRRYYYDYRGNVIQMRELASDGWSATYSTRYDFAGNVTGTLESHTSPANATHILKTEYTRDARGRVLSCARTFDGDSLAEVTYSYDALGRLAAKEAGQALSESYTYDLHGWTSGIDARRGTSGLFSESIRYSSPQKPNAVPLYSGNISEVMSLQHGEAADTYVYSYDGACRLSDARHFIGNSSVISNTNTERSISYDANGNIISLSRYGASFGGHSRLKFSYTGNRLASVADVMNRTSYQFSHDACGNRTSDGRTGLEFSYNILNLPSEVHDGRQNMQMRYTYLSDGTKVSALNAVGKGLLYKGSFVYDKTWNAINLESVAWDEGRIENVVLSVSEDIELIEIGGTIAEDGTFPGVLHPGGSLVTEYSDPTLEIADEVVLERDYVTRDQWFVKDHLGNVRSVVNISASRNASLDNVILEQNDYLPFGTKVAGSSQPSLSANRYRYAGKEEQRIGLFNSQLLDFGTRYYDAYTCSWNAIDPLAHKYFGMSPYNYCGNDPVNFFDPDGNEKIIAMIHSPNMNESKYQRAIEKHKNDNTAPSGYAVYDTDRREYKKNSTLIESMKTATDYSNLCILYAHGAPNGQEAQIVDNNNIHKQADANFLSTFLKTNSEVVKSNEDNNKGSIIVLNSCNTGKGEKSLGCQLSIQMKGSIIIAPSVPIHVDGNADKTPGQWNVYCNGQLVGSFDASAQAYSTYLSMINNDPQKFIEQHEL